MDVPDLPEVPNLNEAKTSTARTLVRLISDEGGDPQVFEFEHEGVTWKVEARPKRADDSKTDRDFTEDLAE